MVKLSENCRAVLHTSMGELTLDLLVSKAPRTVENFVKLAYKGFYDGTTFHRVLKGFMVQGGCPKGDGTGGPGYTIGPEFNDTPHVLGTVSMARSNDPHSGGSQFFIVLGEARYLDSKYSAFAKLSAGEDVLDKIAGVPVFENRWKEMSQPRDAVYINRVELEGVEFDADEGRQESGRAQDTSSERQPDKAAAVAEPEAASSEAAEEADAGEPTEAGEEAETNRSAEGSEETPVKPKRKPASSRNKASSSKSSTKSVAKQPAKSGAKADAKDTTKAASKGAAKPSTKAAKKKSSSRSRDR